MASGLTAVAVLAKATVLVSLAAAARHDVRHRTIPNGLVVVVAGGGLVVRIAEAGRQPVWASLIAAMIVFAVLRWLAAFGAVGGGDAKLIGAVVLGERVAAFLPLLVAISLAGGVLACVCIVIRRSAGRAAAGSPSDAEIPYGVAVLAGGLLVEVWEIARCSCVAC